MNKKENFTSKMVDDYADKLLIGLTREENQMVLDEMASIDEDFQIFENIPNLSEVEPMSWCLDRTIDHLREDVVEESVDLDDLLSNSDGVSDREIEVPRVVSEA